MDSIDPASDCEDVDHGEEVAGELFEARCQSSHILHAAEETLDDVALGVEPGVVGDRVSGCAPGRDDCEGALVCDGLADGSAVVGLVGDDGERRIGPVEECQQDLSIVDLAAGDDEAPGPAMLVYSGMNFGRAASA